MKLTAESFLTGVRQSGLVPVDQLDGALRDLRAAGADLADSQVLAQALIDRGLTTAWQAEKLQQGKFKGFLLGRYRLLELLGRGEMSSIYLALHTAMKRRCAIKVLPAHKVQNTSYLGRFQREAQAVAALDHPHIVRAYDVDMVQEAGADIHFLVMEYVEGRNLERLVEDRQELPVVEAVEYVRQAAEGLVHAHENGLIHRDIQPGNLLIDRKGVVKLLDLGLARFFKESDEESLTIKHDEKVLGTADYLAPEQAVDSHTVDPRADVYSLGCTLYFALTGQPPFTEGTLVQRLLAHQTKPAPSIRRLRPEAPESLAAIVQKAMAKRREDRHQTAHEFADDLTRWLIQNADTGWRRQHAAIALQYSAEGDGPATQAAPADGAARKSAPARSGPASAAARRTAELPNEASRSPLPTVRPAEAPQATPLASVKEAAGDTAPAAAPRAQTRHEAEASETPSPVPEVSTEAEVAEGPGLAWKALAHRRLWSSAALIAAGVCLVAGLSYGLKAAVDKHFELKAQSSRRPAAEEANPDLQERSASPAGAGNPVR